MISVTLISLDASKSAAWRTRNPLTYLDTFICCVWLMALETARAGTCRRFANRSKVRSVSR